jgi:hypothetical protein
MTSRPSPPDVPPIEHVGVRYEQDRYDTRSGDQLGGYLAAIDAKTGTRLWRIKVYDVTQTPGSPGEMALYFRSMHLDEQHTGLLIENEAGSTYRVDLATHDSRQLSGPPENDAVVPASKPKP